MDVVPFFQSIPYDLILIQTVNGIVTGMILALVASGTDADLRHHGRGQFRARRIVHAGRLYRRHRHGGNRQLLAGARRLALVGCDPRRGLQIVTLRPLIGRDPLNTILATFGISLILQNYALWQFGPVARKIQEPITGHSTSSISNIPGTGW